MMPVCVHQVVLADREADQRLFHRFRFDRASSRAGFAGGWALLLS